MTTSPVRNHRDRAAETRRRILDAALNEFSSFGLAGARTERIAAAAGVNKALLYYYFESKEKLYLAALQMIADKTRERSLAVLQRNVSPGERLLRAALDHFDRILAQHEFQSMMQQEMMRHHKGESGAMPLLVERVFAPLQEMYQSTLQEGMKTGELIEADWLQMELAALGANVFYFLSAPVWRMMMPFEPLDAAVLSKRRVALVEFLGHAVFVDRSHGAELAARVLGDMPMPELKTDWLGMRRKNERAQ
ncbi:MAG: TetR family transcriptional regulator [Terracidiphilus sp.]